MKALEKFQQKFMVNELKIFETTHWVWSLRPHQSTFGASILSLKRGCETFGELDQEEVCDLGKMIKTLEPTLKGILCYDVMNYLMLMMFDKHVHFHVFPRFEEPVQVLSELWLDYNWPKTPDLIGEPLEFGKLHEITQYIKTNLK